MAAKGLNSRQSFSGWSILFNTPIIPAILTMIGMFTVSESYRWLLSKNRKDEAIKVILRLKQFQKRSISEFVKIILEGNISIEEQTEQKRFMLWRILRNKTARKSLIFGCSIQALGQIVGINAILYYSSAFFVRFGMTNNQTASWLLSFIYFFNFMPSFVAYKLIDKIGRKKLAIISLFGVFFCLVFLAVSVQVIQVRRPNPYKNYNCSNYLNCPDCVAHGCRFCQIGGNSGYSCADFTRNCNETHSIYDADNPCETKISWVFLFGLICYVISFAVGMGPIPWVITSEIYPPWCRGFNMALSTAVSWLINLAMTLICQTMYYFGSDYVIFWIFSSFTICGITLTYKYVPETNQKNLEEMANILS